MSPRSQAISYLVLGVLAVVGGGYLVITQGGQTLDYLLVICGAVAIFLGVRDFVRLNRES
ncbi:hypothetical protein ATK74_2009 [Propionicimonas paludicola]|uniref:Uncharacterized protein n=1 Tax=Propionicimonas paludicola TaxID=185243 RepID=A0A2A9CV39_9ACTN|nr:hypothetical protein [Propionicimonas paludicola]PFG17439.1 hypothetical protein ATK74_2009 [Propionicimonas paludicola]